jgi:hypothetical protein
MKNGIFPKNCNVFGEDVRNSWIGPLKAEISHRGMGTRHQMASLGSKKVFREGLVLTL